MQLNNAALLKAKNKVREREIATLDLAIEVSIAEYVSATTDAHRESLAAFMLRNSFATGHGDTFVDLLSELEWQVKERPTLTGTATPAAGMVLDTSVSAETKAALDAIDDNIRAAAVQAPVTFFGALSTASTAGKG